MAPFTVRPRRLQKPANFRLEQLEQRLMLTDGMNSFIHKEGEIPADRARYAVRVPLLARQMFLKDDSVLLNVAINDVGSENPMRDARLVSRHGRMTVQGESGGHYLVKATAGRFDVVMTPDKAGTSHYQVDVSLAGDMNGDFRVTGADIRDIASRRGSSSGESGYTLIADVDRDGDVDRSDLNYARTNKKNTVRPRPFQMLDENQGPTSELFHVPESETTTDVEFVFSYGNAKFDNEFGIVVVDDESGSIDGLETGDEGFPQALLSHSTLETIFPQDATRGDTAVVTLPSDSYFTIFAAQDGTIENLRNGTENISGLFSSLADANSDGFDHFLRLGGNRVAFEDLTGGGDRDFNDAIITVIIQGDSTLPVLDLSPIADRTIQEEQEDSFRARVTNPSAQVRYALAGTPPDGATINPRNGRFRWIPAESQGPGNYTVTVQVTDDRGQTDSESFEIAVEEVNRPPQLAMISSQTVTEGDEFVLTVSATDPDIPPNNITFSLSAAPDGATINPVTGKISWQTNEQDGPGEYQFSVQVDDADTTTHTSTKTFLVTVLEAQTPPVMNPIPDQQVDEESLLSFTVSATDLDIPADDLSYSLDMDAPTEATIDSETGVFAWTPNESDGPGSFPLVVHVTDSTGQMDSQTVTIIVNEVHTLPIVESISPQTVSELAELSFIVNATDSDLPQNTLQYGLARGAPTGTAIDPNTGQFTWTPTENDGPGEFQVSVVVNDGTGRDASVTIPITVLEVNLPPVLGSIGNRMAAERAELMFIANATDPDSPQNDLNFSLDQGFPTGAQIDATSGLFSWIPDESQGPGDYEVTIRVADNGTPALSDFETITITVLEDDRPPELEQINNMSVDELGELSFTAIGTDPDTPANILFYSLDPSSPTGAIIDRDTGLFAWTPTESQGPNVFDVAVILTDDTGLTDLETFRVTVNEVNSSPSLSEVGDQQTDEGTLLSFSVSATDPDFPANELTFSLDSSAPSGATIDPLTGLFTWTPAELHGGAQYNITIRVLDNGNPVLEDSETITVTVNETNTAPTISAVGDRDIDEGTELSLTVSAMDSDDPSNSLTFVLDPGFPSGASIDPTAGEFRWTPSESQGPGQFDITVRVDDDGTPSMFSTETFTVTVNEVNQSPLIEQIDDQTIELGQLLTIVPDTSDSDIPSNSLSFRLDPAAPVDMTIDPIDGTINWTPPINQGLGVYPVTVYATDDGLPPIEASVSFDVTVLDCSFEDGLPDWAVRESGGNSGREGSAVAQNCIATLTEGNSFLVSMAQTITIPENATELQFVYEPVSFDNSNPGLVNDAFEVALVDAVGNSLVHTISPDRDVFFNSTDSHGIAAGPRASITGQTVSLILDEISPGIDATLMFRLVNNDADESTSVTITSVEILEGSRSSPTGFTPIGEEERNNDAIDFDILSDVTASLAPSYGRTSFDESTHVLYTDIEILNGGTYSVDNTLVVAVTNISDPTVIVDEPDGITPDGSFYNDLSHLLPNGKLEPSESTLERALSFYNPQEIQFTYELVFLGQLNRGPAFASEPVTESIVGGEYRYDADALDPDFDVLQYSILIGPDEMSIDSSTGEIVWSPVDASLASYSVALMAEDGRGGVAEQDYTISIIDAPPNRPPHFTSVPVVEAALDEKYMYDADAVDLDADPLQYSLAQGPVDMTIDPSSGVTMWTPLVGDAVGSHIVQIDVADGRGGAASQIYTIRVSQESGNHPPIIVTDPVTTAVPETQYTYDVDAIDPDRDVLEYSLLEYPNGMTIDESSGLITWPNPVLDVEFQFAAQIGISGQGRGAQFDKNGFLYISGFFEGAADLDPGPGEMLVQGGGGFVSKLNQNGDLVWATHFPASITRLHVDDDGNVYTIGSLTQSITLETLSGPVSVDYVGGNDVFATKLDPSGNIVWAKSFGGTSNVFPRSIGVGDNGSVYVSGTFLSAIDADPGPSTFGLSSFGGADGFIVKLTADGGFLWANRIGGAGHDEIGHHVVDATGNSYLAGIYSQTVDFDPGPATWPLSSSGGLDVFVTKFNSDGSFAWARSMGGPQHDGRTESNAHAHSGVDIDGDGNVFVSGSFRVTADFDPGPDQFLLTSSGDEDAFVTKLDSQGNFVWAARMGGALTDNAWYIDVNSLGDIYTTGTHIGPGDFDPGEAELILNGPSDVRTPNGAFISVLGNDGTFKWAGSIGGVGTAHAPGLVIAADDLGHMLVGGRFGNTQDFDPGTGIETLSISDGLTATYFSKLRFATNSLPVIVRVDDGRGGSDTQSYELMVINNRPPEIVSQPQTTAAVFRDSVLSTWDDETTQGWHLGRGDAGKLDVFPVNGSLGTGYLRFLESAGNTTPLAFAPSKFLGDYSRLGPASRFRYELRTSANSSTDHTPFIFIEGPGGAAVSKRVDLPRQANWDRFEVRLVEEDWNITSGSWNELLQNVTQLAISLDVDAESILNSGVDNFRLIGAHTDIYTYDVDAIDPDNNPLTYSLAKSPHGMTIDPATGIINWEPRDVVYSRDFNTFIGGEWTPRFSEFNSFGDVIYGRFTNQTAMLTRPTVVGQDYILEFDFYAIDSWDGGDPDKVPTINDHDPDVFDIAINGDIVFHETFHSHPFSPISTQSFPGKPDFFGNVAGNFSIQDSIYRNLQIPFTATSDTTVFEFTGALAGGDQESWALDNVELRLNASPEVTVRVEDGRGGAHEQAFTIDLLQGGSIKGSKYQDIDGDGIRRPGGEMSINATTQSNQTVSRVTYMPNGDLLFAWSGLQLGTYDIYARIFDHEGHPKTNDILVNTTTAGEQFVGFPAVAPDGSFLITWRGNGPGDDTGAFAQRFDPEGNHLGNEFRVNDVTTGTQQGYRAVVLPGGDTYVSFDDRAGGNVVAQRYDDAGNRIGNNFQLNVVGGALGASIVPLSGNRILAAWQRSGIVYLRRFEADGTPIDVGEIQVSSGGTQAGVNASYSDSGNIVLTWYGPDGDQDGAFFRLFNDNGEPIGPEQRANPFANGSQINTAAGMDATGRFIVAWRDGVNDGDVFFRLHDPNGTPTSDPIRANETLELDQRTYGIAMAANGDFVVTWSGNGAGDPNGVHFRQFNADGSTTEEPGLAGWVIYLDQNQNGQRDTDEKFAVSDAKGNYDLLGLLPETYHVLEEQQPGWYQTAPGSGTHVLTITNDEIFNDIDFGNTTGAGEIRGTAFLDANGNGVRDQGLVDQSGPGLLADNRSLPASAGIGSGKQGYVAVWEANGSGGREVLARIFDNDGNALSGDIFVASEPSSNYLPHVTPTVAVWDDGQFVVAWNSDDGAGSVDVAVRSFDSSGNPLGEEVIANTFTTSRQSIAETRPLETFDDGSFIVSWHARDGRPRVLYARRFDAQGIPVGGEISIENEPGVGAQNVSIAAGPDGRYVATWNSVRFDPDGGVHAQLFDAAGSRIGSEFLVNEQIEHFQEDFGAVFTTDGNLVVPFDDNQPKVYFRMFDGFGSPLTSDIFVTDGIRPSISAGVDGDFLISWTEIVAGFQSVHSRHFDRHGQPIGEEFLLSAPIVGVQQVPKSVALCNGDFAVLWYRETDVYQTHINATEPGLEGRTIYLDQNQNGLRDDGERYTVTDTCGNYSFGSLTPGTYYVQEEELPGWYQTAPTSGTHVVTITKDEIFNDIDFGNTTGAGQLHGTKFHDANANGVPDTGLSKEHIDSIVHSEIPGKQDSSDIDSNADRYVIVWHEEYSSHFDVVVRVYDHSGAPITDPIVVDSMTPGSHPYPRVGMWEDGSFVVAWASPGDSSDITVQKFDSLANPITEKSVANTYLIGSQGEADVESFTDGSFLVIWNGAQQQRPGHALSARRYDSEGLPVGDEFEVSPSGSNASISEGATGSYLVTWNGTSLDNSIGVHAQIFAADDTPTTEVFLVNEQTSFWESTIASGYSAEGFFVIPFHSYQGPGKDVDVYVRMFDASGSPISSDIYVGAGQRPDIAIDHEGEFLVVWQHITSGQGGIKARQFSRLGIALSDEFAVSPPITGHQGEVRASALCNGDYGVSWGTYVENNHDVHTTHLKAVEGGLSGWNIYLDQNQNGQRDDGELYTVTDTCGEYSFPSLKPGTYYVREEKQTGWEQTTPVSGEFVVTITSDQVVSGLDFGNRETDEPPIEPANQNPAFTSVAGPTATVGQLFRYDARAVDPDDESLAFDLVVNPDGMAEEPSTGTVVWVPRLEQEGTHDAILRVRDGRGGVALQSFQITATRSNSGPVITSIPHGPAIADMPYSYQVIAQDVDGDTLQYELVGPTGMQIDPVSGQATWTPAIDQADQNHHVAIIVKDGRGASTTQSFELPVVATAPNDPPAITSVPRGRARLGDEYLYQIVASDPNGDPLTFSLNVSPAGMTVASDGFVRWIPTPAQFGANLIEVRVEDGRGGFAQQGFSVNVVSQTSNQPPDITTTPTLAATVGHTYAYDAIGTDPDGDPLMWILDVAPVGMSVNESLGTVRWTPTSEQLGTNPVAIRVIDPNGASTTQSYSIFVRSVNVPPNISSTPPTQASTAESYSYVVRAADPEQDPLEFSLPVAPAGMTIDETAGVILWNPQISQLGDHQVNILVDDGQGGRATQNYTLVVSENTSNNPPVITSTPSFDATANIPYEYQVTASDPDDDTLLFSVVSGPTGVFIDPLTGLLTWSPVTNQIGEHPFVVAAVDPSGAGGTQSYTVIVADDNGNPQITSSPLQVVTAGLSYRYDVQANDPDGDPISYTLDRRPAGMAIDPLGRILWSPGTTDVGTHQVEVTVRDNRGGSQTQSYELVVIADLATPRVSLILSENPAELGATVVFVVSATDNVGVESIGLTIDGIPAALDAMGRVALLADAVGQFEILANASDAAGNVGLAATSLFVIDSSDVDPPSVNISSPVDYSVITAPVDVVGTASDDNLLSFTLAVATVAGGDYTEIARGTNSVVDGVLGTFDPTALANGAYKLRLSAIDAGGSTAVIENIVEVAGDLKIGNFSLSFTDLAIPVSGIPITVTRTYDSLNSDLSDDFGYGWNLEFRDSNLKTSVPISEFEDIGAFQPFRIGTRVYVTLPGGRREGFTFRPTPVSGFGGLFGFLEPAFEPDPGVTTHLSVPSYTLIQNEFGDYLGLVNGGTLAYNPRDTLNFGGKYFLSTADGLGSEIDAVSGDLRFLSDTNGNSLTFTETSIESSNGARVTFERDPQGRITAAIDPAGERVRYQYSEAGDLTSVIDREGNETRFGYNEPRRAHFLTEVIDPLGRSGVRTEYDDQGRLIKLIDVNGEAIELIHDPDNFLETVKDALGNTTTFEYDIRGNVVTEVDSLAGITRRTYDLADNMLTETDPLGNATTFTYDGFKNVLSETDPLESTTFYTHQTFRQGGLIARVLGARPFSRLATVTDGLGNTTANQYDGSGNLASTQDAAGNITRFTYDGAGNQTSITDANGGFTSFAYDSMGNLTSQIDALGDETTFTYDSNGNQLTQSDSLGLLSESRYDSSGRPIKVIDALGNSTTTEYDALGNQSATVDALGRRTDFEYDERGQLVTMSFTDNTSLEMTYDALGRRTSSSDREGNVTRFVYDELGRLTETIYPDDTQTESDNPRTLTEYDAAGRVTAQIDELGNRTEFEYDVVGRQVLVRDALGNEVTTDYDAAGRTASTTDSMGRTTYFDYDELGRQVETMFVDGTTTRTEYDKVGRGVSQTDQLGRITSFEYDGLGRLTTVIDALDQRTEYLYDLRGNLSTQTDANGHSTSFEYDPLGRRVATVLSLDQRSETTYDAVGNVVSTLDFNGDTILFEYDTNNRLTTKTFPDDESVTFTYTAGGRRDTVIDSRGTTSYAYDERDRLLSRADPDGTSISYEYDDAGNRKSVTVPFGTTHYTYDELNRIATVTDSDADLTRYSYNEVGNLVQIDLPNGTNETRQYDDLNRLTFVESADAGGVVISSYAYTLAATGRRDSVQEHDGRKVDYSYDLLDRLIEETITDSTNGNRTINYTYDAVGNRLTRDDTDEGLSSYLYDSNDRLVSETNDGVETTYRYDENGNTVSKAEDAVDQVIYKWDFENRMLSADTDADGTADVEYQYDADGLRVTSIDSNGETRFLLDTNRPYAQVLEEYTPGGVIKVTYVYGLDLISRNRPATTGKSFYHVDGLGSTRALTNGSGNVTDRYIYDAFGRTIGQVGSTGNVYLFAGEQRDLATGLDYLRARWMSPSVGRFYGMDPFEGLLEIPSSRHSFLYTHNNPVNLVDPSGNFSLAELTATVTVQSILASMTFSTFFPAATTAAVIGLVWKPAFEVRNRSLEVISRSTHSGVINAAIDQIARAHEVIAVGANFNDAAQKTFALGGATVGFVKVFGSALQTGSIVVNATKLAQLGLTLDDLIDNVNGFIEPPSNKLQGLFSDLRDAAKAKSNNPQLVGQATGVIRSLFDLVADVITS